MQDLDEFNALCGNSGNGDSGNGDSGNGDSGNGDSGNGDSGNGSSGSSNSSGGASVFKGLGIFGLLLSMIAAVVF